MRRLLLTAALCGLLVALAPPSMAPRPILASGRVAGDVTACTILATG